MYRLLKIPQVHLMSVGSSSQIYYNSAINLCSYCRLEHSIHSTKKGILQIRLQSTINTVLVPSIPAKVKRKPKKYAELLEVTENNVNNRKAAIRKMNASHLSLLVDKNGNKQSKRYDKNAILFSTTSPMDINHDHRIQLSDVDNSHDELGIMEDLQSSGISDSASLIKNISTLNAIPEEHLKNEFEDEENEEGILQNSKTNKRKSSKALQKELKLKKELGKWQVAKHQNELESTVRALKAYLNVCLNCNMMGRAYHTVMHYRNRSPKNHKKVREISIYNILLQAYASRGQYPKVHDLMEVIRKDQLVPNAQTYAAVYECFGNINVNPNKMQFLNKIYEKMKKSNITFDQVLNESRTKVNQYKNVLRGISLIDPNFVPKIETENESYSCQLVKKIRPETATHNSPAEGLMKLPDLMDRFARQIKSEMDGHVVIESIAKIDTSHSTVSSYRKEIEKLEENWRNDISSAFDRDLKALKKKEYHPVPNEMVLYPYLCVLNKEEYVNAIMHEIRKLANGSESFSPSFSLLRKRLGKFINDKYDILIKKQSKYPEILGNVYSKYGQWYLSCTNGQNSRENWHQISQEVSPNFSLELELSQWPTNLSRQIGKFLYKIILNDVKIDTNSTRLDREPQDLRPAFYIVWRHNNRKHLVKEVKPHPTLAKIYRGSNPETLSFETSLLPSECPPRPWSSIRSGGYLLLKSDVIRVPLFAIEQIKRLEVTPPRQLWPALDSLNQLGSVPWNINKPVLDLAIKIFRDGGSVKLNVPQPPSVLGSGPLLSQDSTPNERINSRRAQMELNRKKSEMYSLWCDAHYRLSLANHFRDKIFWLPHNMDFRGRVYPVPPHLSHLGSDLARSIMIFALGKPLGPRGLDWLKIHTINLTGFKKRESIAERLRYANEILDKIIDSAEKPLDGEMWWATSDEPWQTLASCMEIAAALKTPHPEEYVCRFPIHQDGSCNGLQHYAALGRDQIGAESVNLFPSDKPQDVYSNVAAMVDKLRTADAENGLEIAQILEGFVKRKIIKQTVMTTVYGVTKFGARLQIARQLKDLDDYPQDKVWPGSLYLAQKTFESLRTMFESARQIQDWFTDCAQVITTINGKNMEWVTPLGLPVIQPYSKVLPCRNKFMDNATDLLLKPNTSKQKNAFAPNFIHSLDSCHMMLTSLNCEHTGISFVSVHDCYWTHPCSVEIMNRICREQFVALHSEPILQDLSKYFIDKFTCDEKKIDADNLEEILSKEKLHRTLSNVPKRGTFNLKKVLDSTYFFC
ncbi:DNA-directed RNA polymerase, mitochondrial isoform X1 [Cotesia glomerata]|uniref:DNA-directed RNA polymerase n=2 Tax=Cotesia glomerata TaxID=32391 RepID=A0AAV7HGN1_COTGL|nr:DNA-directed RNA polymerase, mitochondrial isoform X1 [Cotesia glomerata]KAH0539281.1 hypothetical protein KQX54_003547 [Cotesia glomerata]